MRGRPKAQASEVAFELHTLGWKAFQDLCVAIAGEVWGQTVQGFADARDGGRDGAFQGRWTPASGESFDGSFTAQCKFSSRPGAVLNTSDLTDELAKASRLAAKGLADNYFLFTNMRLTGAIEESLKGTFEAVPGICRFRAYGVERISQIIRESPRLRMLVPRVYGIGDLSQILDERAYAQAREILSALSEDLSKFVITDAYRRSAKAIVSHGFVLLLGEPACGKSTIAAALALGALDEWRCSTVRVRDARDLVHHWNPCEPRQFFWVDDAFGATQFERSLAAEWNRVFPYLDAAIHKGARVLFTSRDYVYRAAMAFLKESAFPLIRDSKVVIHVEDLTTQEREHILYNHIRLGTQPKAIKSQLKRLLPGVAAHKRFSPEIARRLGNPIFTKGMSISRLGLDNFVARPVELLREVIRTLDGPSRSAIAVVFMRGGTVPSPVRMSEGEEQAVALLGGSKADVRSAFKALEGSILSHQLVDGQGVWRFKHPTVNDAFASLVGEDRELMDIYLAGTPVETIFGEVTCGDVGVEGARVIVPRDRYKVLLDRLGCYEASDQANNVRLLVFLSYRCDRHFLAQYLSTHPTFVDGLRVGSYLYAVSDVDVMVRLHEYGLLPEAKRQQVVAAIQELAIKTPDSGFLIGRIRLLMTDDEVSGTLERVKSELLPKLGAVVDEWRSNFDGTEPEEFFSELRSALEDYRDALSNSGDDAGELDDALEEIDRIVEELRREISEDRESVEFSANIATLPGSDESRSVFDDVDD